MAGRGPLAWVVAVALSADLLLAWLVPAKPFAVPTVGPGPIAGIVGLVLSPTFLLGAAGELALLAALRRAALGGPVGILVSVQIVLLLVTPGLFAPSWWPRCFAFLGSAALVGAFAFVLQWVYRARQISPSVSRYLAQWTFAAAVLAAGWLVWALDGTAALLVPAVVLQFVVAVRGATAASPASGETRVPWLLRPFWTFQLLLFIFLGEFFLGALLDYEIAGPSFLGYIPFLPITGPGWGVAGSATYDGLWFAAAIMASAWFLVAVGITMGSLVVLRLREVHVPAQRYRMVLTLGFFALAAVFLPSLVSSTPLVSNATLASLPLVGWGFGLRDGGPFESGTLLAVLIMYASVGVLTVLFGRKALCSVMCGAAILYQGSTVHDMRQFHQTSRIGQYFLGKRLTTAYAVASGMALVSLFGISLLALFHDLPTVQVANGKFDTSALPLPIEFYFGGIWFVMFVSTPYLGTYNCASTGFCHWGALSIPFTRASLFRLRVRDRGVCQKCTTFDCAKSCPVGLVDMPLYFRSTGEYRSSKCCGVGDCVGACPYGNLYHQDVRFWLLRGLRRLSFRQAPRPLPMVNGPTSPPATLNAEPAGRGDG